MCWLELVSEVERPLLPVSQRLIESWRNENDDIRVHSQSVVGDTFWATQEIATAPALLDVSVKYLCDTVDGI